MKVPFCDWDECAQELKMKIPEIVIPEIKIPEIRIPEIKIPRGTVIVSRDTVAPSDTKVMGGFVVGASGLDATLIWGSDSPQLIRLQVVPERKED